MIERIEIDRLVIRLRHLEPRLARKAMEGLGSEVLHALASQGSPQTGGLIQVHQMDLGVLSNTVDPGAAGIRRGISRAVSGAIQAKRTGGEGE